MRIPHFKILDGIRAMAALMVMLFHFFQNIKQEGAIVDLFKMITAFGRTGVTLFFVLSGFLITRILLSTKDQKNYFKAFYTRRALRIFPLYYLFLILFYFIIPAVTNAPIVGFDQQWTYWLFFQNISTSLNQPSVGPGHFWSLGLEENFYFFWPFIIYKLNSKQLYYVIGLILLVSLGSRLYFLNQGYGEHYFTLSSVDALVIGAVLALNEKKSGFPIKSAKRYLLLFTMFCIPSFIFWFLTEDNESLTVQVLKFPLITMVYLAFIGCVLIYKEQRFIRRIFGFRPLVYLGKISYGLYVFHPLCFYFYFQNFHTNNFVVDLLITFTVSFFISSITYHLFETPFLKLKDNFTYKNI